MTEFSALYQKYAPDVFRFALYLSGNRAEAEDITSEAFVRVWTSPEPIRAETVKGYLFTIARNLYLQGLRKSKRHAELDEQMADHQASPLAQAEQKAEFLAVLTGLQELPETDRSAVLLRGRRVALRRDCKGPGDYTCGGEDEDLPRSPSSRENSKHLGGDSYERDT